MKPNDVFVEVDGVRFDDGKATPDDVAVVVRGPEGSKVGVVVERDGKNVDFILTREPIKITSVRSYMGDKSGVGKVGVIRIKNFSGTTAETVKTELESLKKKGATNIVLDLRGEPFFKLFEGTMICCKHIHPTVSLESYLYGRADTNICIIVSFFHFFNYT